MPSTRRTTASAATTVAADLAAARGAIPGLVRKAADVVAHIQDPDADSALAPWTVGETAVHLANTQLAYVSSVVDEFGDWLATIPRGGGLKGRLAELNTSMLDMVAADQRSQIPGMMVERARCFIEATEGRDPEETCRTPWFGADVHLPLSAVAGLFLSETLLHGLDIARASQQGWHIDPDHARLVLSLVYPAMMPLTVSADVARGLTARIHYQVRGGVTIGVAVDDGNVAVTRNPAAGGPGPDCRLLLDPVAFLLFSSGRIGQYRQIALGRIVPYGRKPWLAPKAARLFYFP